MRDLIGKEILTKEKLISLINEAKQDEYGHWYLEIPQDDFDIRNNLSIKRVYFGMFYTVCEDFVDAFTSCAGWDKNDPESIKEVNKENTEHYNRHFWNDDTFELYVAKNVKTEENSDVKKEV